MAPRGGAAGKSTVLRRRVARLRYRAAGTEQSPRQRLAGPDARSSTFASMMSSGFARGGLLRFRIHPSDHSVQVRPVPRPTSRFRSCRGRLGQRVHEFHGLRPLVAGQVFAGVPQTISGSRRVVRTHHHRVPPPRPTSHPGCRSLQASAMPGCGSTPPRSRADTRSTAGNDHVLGVRSRMWQIAVICRAFRRPRCAATRRAAVSAVASVVPVAGSSAWHRGCRSRRCPRGTGACRRGPGSRSRCPPGAAGRSARGVVVGERVLSRRSARCRTSAIRSARRSAPAPGRAPPAPALMLRVHRRPAVHDPFQACQVAPDAHRVVHDHVDLGGHQEHRGDPVSAPACSRNSAGSNPPALG